LLIYLVYNLLAGAYARTCSQSQARIGTAI